MPIRSMTGFGEAEFHVAGYTGRVACRSVNHKNLEIRSYLPREFAELEAKLTGRIKNVASRGRVELRVELNRDKQVGSVDPERFAETASALNALAEMHNVERPTFRDVVSAASSEQTLQLPDDAETVAKTAVDVAVAQWNDAREKEGSALEPTLVLLFDTIQTELAAIEARQAAAPDEARNKLQQRLDDLLKRLELGEIDEQRLSQELVFYVDRSDIAEEIQRANSHVDSLTGLVANEIDKPVGKKMDFYLQELFRECNTMGSKTSDLEITASVIEMKSAVEKLREQAANIE